jgi:hypothetical protein
MNTTKTQPTGSLRRMVRRLHVIPIGDEEIHAAQTLCWCHPTAFEAPLWVHNARDCREAKERATGVKCSDGWVTIAEYVEPTITIEPLTGKWVSCCTVCGMTYENGCGSTPCCGALQEIVDHQPGVPPNVESSAKGGAKGTK